MNFTCSTSHLDHTATITPRGDIDLGATTELREAVQVAARDEAITTIVVDLTGVTFMDSTALGVLVAAHTAALRRGATFTVTNPGPMVTMVLTVTGLMDVLVPAEPGSAVEDAPALSTP